MQVPEDLRYTHDHEWLRIEGDEAIVGITEYAASELGDVVFVELPAAGCDASSGAVVWRDRIGQDRVGPVRPGGGRDRAINDALADKPELVNNDPYGDGWMIRIRLADPRQRPSASDGLMDAAAYRALIEAG